MPLHATARGRKEGRLYAKKLRKKKSSEILYSFGIRGPSSNGTESPVQFFSDAMCRITHDFRQGVEPAVAGRLRPRNRRREPLSEWIAVRKPSCLGFPYSQFRPIGLSVPLLLGPLPGEAWSASSCNAFIYFARHGEMTSNSREDQEISMLSLHLFQNCMVYLNTLMLQEVLAQPHWQGRLTETDLRALTPLTWEHVKPYGRFELDMTTRLPIK